MTLEEKIKSKFNSSRKGNLLLERNLFKEELQNFVLNFVYNSKYKNLIFTGGTCLRKCYGLNRLSEDLNFDYIENFNINEFSNSIKDYFKKSLGYKNITTKIANNNRTLFLKFPILKDLNLKVEKGMPEDLFLRCDFLKDNVGNYNTEINLIKAGDFEFFVLSYNLETLFANKISAFLQRVFYKRKFQKIPFKGRDVYDLFWFFQLSQKTGFNLKPNKKRLLTLTKEKDIKTVKNDLKTKLNTIDEKFVYEDLSPLLESSEILIAFKNNFKKELISKLNFIL